MNHQELRGVIVPVITPTDKKENVDEPAFRKHLSRLIDAGVHAIFVGGSAGEGPLLTDAQYRRMVEIAFDEVGGRLPLLGGAMDTSAQRVCDKVKTLKSIGYRFFVLTPTFYIANKTSTEQLRLFGQAKEAAGKMEMVAYNIPQCTGSILAVDTACEMARRGWIRYCKESSGDWNYLKTLIRRGKAVGLDVLAGDELIMDQALLAGAKGVVPVCANYIPREYVRFYEAGRQGDRKTLAEQKVELLRIRETLLLTGVCWISGIKYAMSALGIGSGMCVSPLEPAETKRMALIDALVKTHSEYAGKSRKTTGRKTSRATSKGFGKTEGRK
jgi:4-hydroxy-tetrahydrodipicolinate synthase